MDILLQTVVLIGELPGSLVYHLVLLFALEMAAALAFSGWRRERNISSARMLFAALTISLLYLASLVVTLLDNFGLLQGLIVLPPLTRAIQALAALIMIWAFAFPSPSRPADALTLLLGLGAAVAVGVSWVTWAQAVSLATAAYNGTFEDALWGWAQVALLGAGLIVVIARRRDNWLIGVTTLLLLMAGQIIHLSFLWPGTSLPGTVRLAELVAVPMFTAIVYRRAIGARPPAEAQAMPAMVVPAVAPVPPTPLPPAPSETPGPRRHLDPKAAVALASLSASADPDELAQIITLAVAHTCRAELCLLISPPDDLGMCSLTCAYDLVREQFIAGTFLSVADLPALRATLAQNTISHLSPSEHAVELRRLNGAAGIGPIGPTLIAPLHTDQQRLGALALVAMYSHRDWAPEDENLLGALLGPINDALGGDNQVNRLLRDLEKTQSQVEAADAARRAARTEADQLSVALEAARGEAERLNQAILQLRQEMGQLKPVDDVDALRSTILAEHTINFAEIEAEWRGRLEAAELEAEARGQQVAGLKAELEALRDRLKEADQQRTELKLELEPLRANLASLAAQTATPTSDALTRESELQAEVARLRAELGAAKARPAESVLSHDGEQEAELVRLRAELDAVNAQLAQQVEAASGRDPALEAEVERLRAELSAANARQAQHLAREHDHQAELEHLRAELGAARAAPAHDPEQETELGRLRAELSAAQARLAQPSAVGSTTREAELQDELAHLRAELDLVNAQLAQYAEGSTIDAPDTHSELERLRAELSAANAQQAQQAQAATAHEAQVHDELERLRAELDGARGQLVQQAEAAAAREADIQNQVERLRSEQPPAAQAAEMQAQLDAERQKAAEWRDRFDAAQRDLGALTQRAAQLAQELEHNRTGAAQPDLRDADAERARLEAQIKELREYAEAQHWQLATFKFDYDFALQQEQQLRKELELTRTELRRLSEERDTAPVPAEADGQALTAAQSALAEAQSTLEAKQAELAQAQTALGEARQELAARERQLAKAQGVVASLNDQARQLTEVQAELDDLRTQLTDAQTALGETQDQLGAKETELAHAVAALAELANQTHTLTLTQKQLAEKERQLAEAQATRPSAGEPDSARPFLPEASMEVIASLSQELRQPMAAIVGYSELLLGESVGILGALQRKFLERIKASCERMDGLLNDLMRVTDIDAGTLQLVPESLDVMYIIEDAILSCGAQFREKGINLRLDIADQLPSISADRDALRQIIAHLLSNAGNASASEGEVVLKVRAEVDPASIDPASHALLIAVRDSGGGIAPEDQPRVFSRFYRADAPLIAGLGETGVGLSVAKALVEAHGGRIWLTSDPGLGSTFTVVLPLHGKNGSTTPWLL